MTCMLFGVIALGVGCIKRAATVVNLTLLMVLLWDALTWVIFVWSELLGSVCFYDIDQAALHRQQPPTTKRKDDHQVMLSNTVRTTERYGKLIL